MQKRKADRDDKTTNKSRKVGDNFSADYFVKISEECGLELNDGSEPKLNVEPAIFIRNLNSKLENNVDRERNITEFVNGFKEKTKEISALEKFCNGGNEAVARILIGSGGRIRDGVACYLACRALDAAIQDNTTSFRTLMAPLLLADCQTAPFAEAIVQLLQTGGTHARLELLAMLPEIITRNGTSGSVIGASNGNHSHLVADAVSELLSEDEALIPATLSCLSCLKLSPELRTRSRERALSLLKSSTSPTFYQNLIDFLFSDSTVEAENADSIATLRTELDWRGIGGETEEASSQALVCLALRNSITKSKKIAAAWIKAVAVAPEPEPFDPVILLILHSTSPSREKPTEILFAKKAKLEVFTPELLLQTFDRFGPMLRLHTKDWSEITRKLLGSADSRTAKLAESWLRMAFLRFEDCRRNLIFELTRRDCSEDEVAARMNLLMRIADDDLSSLRDHSFQLLSLVDHFEESSERAKTALDLVCRLAFAVDDSKIRDDVRMMIAKRLSSSRVSIKSCGVVGAAAAIKYLAGRKTENSNPSHASEIENDSCEISDLPEGPTRDAATLMELALKSASKFTDLLILFYDELSLSLQAVECWDSIFLNWLSLMITNDFQSNFIIDAEAACSTIKGTKLAIKFCLNSVEEADEQIVLNIAELVFDTEKNSKCDIRMLPSIFKLMRTAYEKQSDGDLSEIDALLGCGVLLPDINFESKLEDFHPDTSRLILDCYCHCLNWFRELIEAFSSNSASFLRKRVVERLNASVYLQYFVSGSIENLKFTEYKPPKCNQTFNIGSKLESKVILKEPKKKATTKKSKKSTETENVETQALETQPSNKSFKTPEINYSKNNLSSQILREIGINCLKLLGENIVIEQFSREELLSCSDFNMSTLLYLLEEIVPKLSSLFEEPSKFNLRKPQKTIVFPIDKNNLIDNFVKLLPNVCANLEKIAELVQNKLDECNGIRDATELYTEYSLLSQYCFAALFQILKLFFIQLKQDSNQTKFKNVIKIVACLRDSENQKKNLMKDLVLEALLYFLRYKEWCLQITSAVNLIGLLSTLASTSEINTSKYIHQISSEFLAVTWYDAFGIPEKGLQYNQTLNTLLSSYFARPKITAIKEMLFDLKDQVPKLKNSSHVLNNMQSINKLNFPLLYRALYNALYEAAKFETNQGITDKQHIDIWNDVALSLKYLIEILKLQETRNNLLTFLKKSIPLFKLFLSQGIPILEIKLKDDPDSVVEILKLLQYSTRFLQTLNCHSRLKKDTSFMAYQPQMKLILESLIYKVKGALITNNCSEAFWMGNLKNKDLNGEIISSQVSIQTDDGDEDQLPDDDSVTSDIEDDIDVDSKSLSNVF